MLFRSGRLTILAQKYYGEESYWVYIYESNRDRYPNPNSIEVGSLIYIPALDSLLIDVSNPLTIEYAKSLQKEYIP